MKESERVREGFREGGRERGKRRFLFRPDDEEEEEVFFFSQFQSGTRSRRFATTTTFLSNLSLFLYRDCGRSKSNLPLLLLSPSRREIQFDAERKK